MQEKNTHFYSDGIKLDASFYFPEDKDHDPDKPLIIINSGFLGLKEIHPARFGRALTKLGYPCFGFDYRGFGKSEGDWHNVLLEEQTRDIINACAYALSTERAPNGIVLVGWGMAGGLILDAAKQTPNILGLIACNGFYLNRRVQKMLRGSQGWHKFYAWVHHQRMQEVQTGKIRMVDPFEVYPLDPETKEYVDNVLRKEDDFAGKMKLTFAYSLLNFSPEDALYGLKNTPILIAHGDKNKLHPTTEAESLYEKYPGDKDLYWIKNAGHTEWMFDEDARFKSLIDKIDNWITEKTPGRNKDIDELLRQKEMA